MKLDQIELGDIVKVNFNNAHFTLCAKAIVKRIPQATGDSWIFQDCKTDEIHYVSEGCTITLIEK